MHRSPTRRMIVLFAATAAVALGGLSVRAQNIVVSDHFDDGNLATNTTGTGAGFVPIGMNGATAPVETGGAFHVDTTPFGDYAAMGASSKNGFDFWNSGGATVQWTTGNAAVAVDQAGSLGQFPGGVAADWRQELGIVSGHRSNTDGITDELYANAQGGLYINLYYDRAGGSGPLPSPAPSAPSTRTTPSTATPTRRRASTPSPHSRSRTTTASTTSSPR